MQTPKLGEGLVTFSDFSSKMRGLFKLYTYSIFIVTLNK